MNVQQRLYTISLVNEIVRNEKLLLNYYLWQNLGRNFDSAISCSLIHYLLNKKLSKEIEYFITPKQPYKQTQSQQISKILSDSLKTEVPIQIFFLELQKLDSSIEMMEIMLYEFCHLYRLTDQNKICIDKLASFFDLTIIQLPNIHFGKSQNILHLFYFEEIYYFLIPDLSSKKKIRCNTCDHKIEAYFELFCQHYVCYNCVQKAQKEMLYFKCKCGKIEQTQTISQILQDALKIHQNKIYTVALENYYKTQSNEQVQNQDQILSASEASDSYQDESLHEIQDITDECYQCEVQSLTKYFVVKECKHKFCYDCIRKEFQYEECGGCYCLACCATITRPEFEQYQEQIKQNLQENNNICSTCGRNFQEELFVVVECNHQYCDDCIQNVFSRNYFREFICSYKQCNSIFSKQDYQNFKMQQMNKISQIQQQQSKINLQQIQQSSILTESECNQTQQSSISQQFSQIKPFQQNNVNFIVSEIMNTQQSNFIQQSYISNSSQVIFQNSEIQQSYHFSNIVYCDKCKQLNKDLFEVEGCSHRFCRDCLQNQYTASSILGGFQCLNSGCRNMLSKQLIKQFLNDKQTDNNEQERFCNLDEILARKNCDCCNQESDQNFLINNCFHKFCHNCLNKDIIDIQGDEIKCLVQDCQSEFKRIDFYQYLQTIQTETITPQIQQQSLSIKTSEINIQNHQVQKTTTLKVKLKQEYLKNQENKAKIQPKSNIKTKEPCSFCKNYNLSVNLYQIKCGDKICSKCASYLTKQNTRCKICLLNFDDLNFQKFKLNMQLTCEICQISYQKEEVFQKSQCRHQLCFNCVYQLYHFNQNYQCLVTGCNKPYNVNYFTEFCLKFDVISDKQNIIQVNSDHIVQKPKAQQIIQQSLSIIQQQLVSAINQSCCSLCYSEFSDYNQKQQINCQFHLIGVCCIKNQFKRCPMCEKPYRRIVNGINLKKK